MAVDDFYTVCLLHFNGTDASTTFTDESGKVWTAVGNAQIDTAQSVFGGASGLFDGTGDRITCPDSDDWQLDGGSASSQWTIDLRVRFNVDPSADVQGFIQQRVDNNNYWGFYFLFDCLAFIVRSGGVTLVEMFASGTFNPNASQWYHVAVVKNGVSGYKMFVDGVEVDSDSDAITIPNFAGSIQVGRYMDEAGVTHDLNGWLDEFRISKGIARWTENFMPPPLAYAPQLSGFFF